MAPLKNGFKQKVTASSILEVVVSMVIIVMVLGISLMIYSNVARQSLSAKQLNAQFLLQQAVLKAEKGMLKETELIEQWQITKDTKRYEAGTRLVEIYIKVYDDNHNMIAETRKVIIGNEAE